MRTHEIPLDVSNLHDRLDPERPPIVTVDPGDVVRLAAPDVSFGIEPPRDTVSPRRKLRTEANGPAVCGPVAVRSAEPRGVLAVEIREIVTSPWGWTYAGGPDIGDRGLNRAAGVADGPLALLRWTIDRETGLAVDQHGRSVPLRPFPGTIGLARATGTTDNAWHPGRTGGNLDCRELVVGSTLILPIEAPGGLLYVGDGHAAQGDGEVAGTAIECAIERIVLRLSLVDDWSLSGPVAITPGGLITFGFGESLDDAANDAMRSMLALVPSRSGNAPAENLAWLSAVMDLRITQMVNGVRGVHAIVPAARSLGELQKLAHGHRGAD